MPQVNLLPREIMQRQRDRRVIFAVIGAGGVLVIILAGLFVVASNNVAKEERELARLTVETGKIRADVARLQQFEQLQQDVTQRRTTLGSVLTVDVAWSKFLNDLSLIMPDNSWLTNLSLSAAAGSKAATGEAAFGSVTFTGFVFDFPGLAGWLTRMSQIEGLTFLYLGSGTRQELEGQRVISFSANASINQSLLSLRCQEGKRCP